MFECMRSRWGKCKKIKETCAINLFVYKEITAKAYQSQAYHRALCCTAPQYLHNASSAFQGDAQQTLACDMMHCSPEVTMSSYDEHVCLTIFRAIMENNCFNISEQWLRLFWRNAERPASISYRSEIEISCVWRQVPIVVVNLRCEVGDPNS